ncbi:MAG: hypothetical protein AAF993_16895 [Pseudomonadota bacterium]
MSAKRLIHRTWVKTWLNNAAGCSKIVYCGAVLSLAVFLVPGAFAQTAANTLSAAELAAEPGADALTNIDPIAVSETAQLKLEGILEFGYQDAEGRYVVDLLEQDKAYLGVRITTPDGKPVVGAIPEIAIDGSSSLLLTELTTAEDGVMNFGVIGGQMGLDVVTASLGSETIEFAINVISLRAAGFPVLEEVEGGIPWDQLLQARLDYEDMRFIATFPDSIKAQAGKTVKLTGFMMPLEPDLKQKHFLLTSNPPSCFFHVPGGRLRRSPASVDRSGYRNELASALCAQAQNR